MKKLVFLFAAFSFASTFGGFAQNASSSEAEAPRSDIFETLTNNTNKSKGSIVLNQDPRLKDLVLRAKEAKAKNMTFVSSDGYRVQLFSSNEQRTAKTQAYKIEERVKEKFPELGTYVTYASPFWKVRVGDCLSQEEAQQLRDDLQKVFTDLRQSTYVVKDAVFLPE